ncbi:MAG: SDR family oxidoreductase [Steroidobacteraceae bacterium]
MPIIHRQAFLNSTFLSILLLATAMGAGSRTYAAEAHTVLITGSSRGIGLELARQYAERGWRVLASARHPSDSSSLQDLASAHKNVDLVELDVTDHAAIDELATRLKSVPIDLLIHNAGIAGDMGGQRFGQFDYDSFRKTLEVNTIGPLKLTEALAGNLSAAGDAKVVLLGTSEASFARIDAARLYWYRASKAAAHMLMRNLAFELAPRHIAVAVVNPGPVDTDMMKGVHMPLQPPAEAVSKVIAIIDTVDLEHSGRFWNYSGGEVPW